MYTNTRRVKITILIVILFIIFHYRKYKKRNFEIEVGAPFKNLLKSEQRLYFVKTTERNPYTDCSLNRPMKSYSRALRTVRFLTKFIDFLAYQ